MHETCDMYCSTGYLGRSTLSSYKSTDLHLYRLGDGLGFGTL